MDTNTNDIARLFFLDPHPYNRVPVLLLHGLGTEASSWTYQFDALAAAGYRPIAPDLPGFGRSPFNGESWSIQYASKVIIGLADSLGIDRFHLAGISMGGTVALQMAIDNPDRITSLVLINTFATLRPKRWDEWIYLLRRYFRARVRGAGSQAELTASRIFPRPDQEELRQELVAHIRQTDPVVYKQAMRELAVYDAHRNLKNIRIPSLVISASNDTTVPLENQHDLFAGIPGCRQVFIENAGHGVIIDQPDRVNQTMIEFMNLFSI
jgi:pimeloyl-ACP methyl ester carboxylesterase